MAIHNWITASSQLHGRCKDSRKIGNNTYLKRRSCPISRGGNDGDAFAILLHSTDVLTFYPDGSIDLDNGGYPTCTTHARMNEYLPSGYRVSGEPLQSERRGNDGMTVLSHCIKAGDWENGIKPVYEEVTCDNSATINADGSLDGGDVAKYREERREERLRAQRPRNRARYWANKVREGKPYTGTLESIMQEENATVRVAKMKCYGIERYFLDAGAKVVEEVSGYQLLELPLTRWSSMRALKMACTTTGAVYVNPVPEYIRTVAESLDWIFDTKDYLGTVGQQS